MRLIHHGRLANSEQCLGGVARASDQSDHGVLTSFAQLGGLWCRRNLGRSHACLSCGRVRLLMGADGSSSQGGDKPCSAVGELSGHKTANQRRGDGRDCAGDDWQRRSRHDV